MQIRPSGDHDDHRTGVTADRRSPGPRYRRRAVVAVGVVVGAAAVTVATVAMLPGSGKPPRHVASSPPTVAVVREAPQASPSSPAPPQIPHDRVPAAVPVSFVLTGPAFTIKAEVCAMPAVFPLDPPGDQHHRVCWVQGNFGVAPGSDTGTSYVLGHSWAPDPLEVLNRLSEPATRELLAAKPVLRDGVQVRPVHAVDGYRLILRTPTGTLTYKVRDAFGVAKNDLGSMAGELDGKVKGRVVLITCAERNGVDYDYNVVLDAFLYSSKAASPAGAPPA